MESDATGMQVKFVGAREGAGGEGGEEGRGRREGEEGGEEKEGRGREGV